jgi:hypothetical protein
MNAYSKSAVRGIAAAAAFFAVGALQPAQAAEPQSKQIETEAVFQKYDPAASTITVQVIKPGSVPKGVPKLQKGKEAVFKVKSEGTVLTRTTVKLLTGQAAKFEDLQAGKKVKIFWVPDEADKSVRFARSVSIFKPTEEQGEDVEDQSSLAGEGVAGEGGDAE